MNEPIPAIPLEYAKAEKNSSPALRSAIRVCHYIALASCVVGTLWIAFIDTQWGVLSGLPIFTAGILLIALGPIKRDWCALVLGISHVGVCLLFVLLVNLLHWNPGNAHMPFSIMGAIYSVVAVAASIRWGNLWRTAARTS